MSRGPGQAVGPSTRRFRTSRWPTTPSEAGPQGFGAIEGGMSRGESWVPPKPYGLVQPLRRRSAAANDLEVDSVARLLGGDHVDEPLDRRDGLPVDLDDDVAAGRPAFAFDRDVL